MKELRSKPGRVGQEQLGRVDLELGRGDTTIRRVDKTIVLLRRVEENNLEELRRKLGKKFRKLGRSDTTVGRVE